MNTALELKAPGLKTVLGEMLRLKTILENELTYAQNAVTEGYNVAASTLIRAVTEDDAANHVIAILVNAVSVRDARQKVAYLLSAELNMGDGNRMKARIYNDAVLSIESWQASN